MASQDKHRSSLHQRFQQRLKAVQSFRAKYDTRRSTTERIIDTIAAFCGSKTFLVTNAIIFAVWLLLNTKILGLTPFDPFPFVLLTTIVSLEAIFLSIFVLISQNRQARVADLREEIDLQINMISEEEITKIMHLLAGLYKGLKIKIDTDSELHAMLQPINTDEIEKRLEEQMAQEDSSFKK